MTRALVFVLLVLSVAAAACSGGGSDDWLGVSSSDDATSPGDAAVDRRAEVLAELGSPDAFIVSADEVDGSLVRYESWMYHEAAKQIDFADGEILWTVDLDELADGSLYPLQYEPAMFTLLSSIEEIRSLLPDVDLTEIALDDEAIPGGVFLAGDQLLLGFVDDRLVYIESFPLAPGES